MQPARRAGRAESQNKTTEEVNPITAPGVRHRQVPAERDYFSRPIARRPEIIEGILREGQIGIIAGPFNVGKTPLLTQIQVCVATGTNFCGRKVDRRPIVAIDMENPPQTYIANVRNIAARIGVAPPPVPAVIDPYLELDDSNSPNTAALLLAVRTSHAGGSLRLVETALQSKPTALVIIDPFDMLFRVDSLKKQPVLDLYAQLRGLLSQFPDAAVLLVHNLRKKIRSAKAQPNLLRDPADWLEEVCGSLDIVNRSDVRIGMAHLDDGRHVRIIHGIRRGEEMEPLIIEPAEHRSQLAGFELASSHTVREAALTEAQKMLYSQLPQQFRFQQIANKLIPKSSLSRLLSRLKALNLVGSKNGVWRKM